MVENNSSSMQPQEQEGHSILAARRATSKLSIITALSVIAATLLKGGRTAHRQFGDVKEDAKLEKL